MERALPRDDGMKRRRFGWFNGAVKDGIGYGLNETEEGYSVVNLNDVREV